VNIKATKIEIALDAATQRRWDDAEPTRGYRTLVRLLGDNGRIFYETTGSGT
jgi:hypothetical protein